MKTQKINIIGLIVNLVMIGIGVAGLTLGILDPKVAISPDNLKLIEVLALLITLLASFLMIFVNIVNIVKKKDCTPRLFFSIRLMSAALSFLSVVTIASFINFPGFNGIKYLTEVSDGSLFYCLILPILAVLEFIFLEIEPEFKFKKIFEPFFAVVLYVCGIITYVFIKGNASLAPYFFFDFPILPGSTAELINVGYLSIFIALAFALPVLLWSFNRIFSVAVIGIEYGVPTNEEGNVELNKTKKPMTVKEFVTSKIKFTGSGTQLDHVYHISYHDRKNRTWKVKYAGAARALKVFPNQKEAIEFAKGEVAKHGGAIRIHSTMGRIRAF